MVVFVVALVVVFVVGGVVVVGGLLVLVLVVLVELEVVFLFGVAVGVDGEDGIIGGFVLFPVDNMSEKNGSLISSEISHSGNKVELVLAAGYAELLDVEGVEVVDDALLLLVVELLDDVLEEDDVPGIDGIVIDD